MLGSLFSWENLISLHTGLLVPTFGTMEKALSFILSLARFLPEFLFSSLIFILLLFCFSPFILFALVFFFPGKGLDYRRHAKALGTGRRKRTATEVYHVAFLLNQLVPGDLVPMIMDYAEVWQYHSLVSSLGTMAMSAFNDPKGKTVPKRLLPPGISLRAIRTINFFVYATEPDTIPPFRLHGATSRTDWTEAAVFLDDQAPKEYQERFQPPVEREYHHKGEKFMEYEFEVYVAGWLCKGKDTVFKMIVRALVSGEEVSLFILKGPQPCGGPNLAEIEVQVALVRRM